jgi:hypothetical protein
MQSDMVSDKEMRTSTSLSRIQRIAIANVDIAEYTIPWGETGHERRNKE